MGVYKAHGHLCAAPALEVSSPAATWVLALPCSRDAAKSPLPHLSGMKGLDMKEKRTHLFLTTISFLHA